MLHYAISLHYIYCISKLQVIIKNKITMNNNKIKLNDSLIIMCTMKINNRTYYLNKIRPYNINNDIVIEEIDENRDIIGSINLDRESILYFASHLIEIAKQGEGIFIHSKIKHLINNIAEDGSAFTKEHIEHHQNPNKDEFKKLI